MVEEFRKFIENYTQLPDDEWALIKKSFERKEFKKNEMILRDGEICRYFYFLEEGLIRFFTYNDGNDITKFFTIAPFCFTSQYSFRNRVQAQENIQAVEKVVAWRTSLEKADRLLELKYWGIFTRKFVQEVQYHTETLLTESKTLSAETRYLALMNRFPDLIQRIPLQHLATFLGIAPQSLSRIRKKFASDSKT